MIGRYARIALGGVAGMSIGEFDRIDRRLCGADPTCGLDPPDGRCQRRIDEPIAGRHGSAVMLERLVAKPTVRTLPKGAVKPK